MKAEMIVPWGHSLPTWLDGAGQPVRMTASRLDAVPTYDGDGLVPTCRVLIEADVAVIDAMAAHPDYLFVQEVVDDAPA